ncbi:MAG: glycosyltransferase family 39 protein [candidate division WOR-3 bacterium]
MRRMMIPVLIALVLLVGLLLRVRGLQWGIPTGPHYRNYYQDERFSLGLVYRMNPARLNFDPHYYINPSLHYYTMLGVLGMASALGLPLHLPVEDDSPLRPGSMSGQTYAATFLICRWLVVIQSVLSILVLYLIGRRLYSERAGLLAALLFSVNYASAYQAHFITPDGPAVAWLILALYLVVLLHQEPSRRIWKILAPVGIGLAIGAKYLNALVLIPYLVVLVWRAISEARPDRVLKGEQVRGQSRRNARRLAPPRGWGRRLATEVLSGLAIVLGAFLITTPYALLSFQRFLHGDENGFGGIFGRRGLFFYNNFPPSLVEPFAVTTRALLNPLGLVVLLLGLIVLFKRRRSSDILLLSFIVPFYLMLVAKSSPMLRHVLPVLPFLCLALAGGLADRTYLRLRVGPVPAVLLLVLALSWLGLSVAAVERMERPDTRQQVETWVRQNVTTETIALPTYFPYRYTPAIDSFHLLPLNYDYRLLETKRPEYLLMVEPEYRVNGRSDDKAFFKEAFVAALGRMRSYVLVQRFAEPFRLLGWNLPVRFPTEDWSYPSPEILVFRRL